MSQRAALLICQMMCYGCWAGEGGQAGFWDDRTHELAGRAGWLDTCSGPCGVKVWWGRLRGARAHSHWSVPVAALREGPRRVQHLRYGCLPCTQREAGVRRVLALLLCCGCEAQLTCRVCGIASDLARGVLLECFPVRYCF